MARRVSSPDFVGREAELAALLGALDRAAGGEFSAVFVAGESGVGKSRLLSELMGAARERGARVLVGDCVMLAEGELPYAPVRAALRGLAAELEPEALDELLGSARFELARLAPDLGGADASARTESIVGASLAQPRLFELVLTLLGRLGREAPVVLTIEDIHWADPSTRDLIAFLVGNVRRERLLLVCTYRTDELHRRHPFRRFVARHESRRSVERVDVLPFTQEELGAQLRGILGSEPDVALRQRLFERTGGNAFLAEELLAASPDGNELPASLRDALMVRIEMLPDPAQRVLRVSATHGRFVPYRLLAAVCELSDPELGALLREAVANHVLVQWDEESLAFRHALTQETLHADLLPGERTRLHLALAQALDDDPTLVSRDGRAAAELYSHWLGAHRFPEALAAAVRAGGEAEDVYAFAEASHHLEHALELWERVDDAEERAGLDEAALYARAGEDAYLSGEQARAITLVRLAIRRIDSAADATRAALLRERLGRYLWLAGDAEAAHAAYQDAVDLMPADEPRRERARVLAALGQLLFLRGHIGESIEVTERAIAVARHVGARAEEGHALSTLGANATMLGDRESGKEQLREALQIAEELGEIADVCRAYRHLSDALDQDGELEASTEVALEGAQRASELGLRSYALILRGEAATHALKLGRLAQADRLTAGAVDAEPTLRKAIPCEARAWTLLLCGRLDEAEVALAVADEAFGDADSMWVGLAGAIRAELAVWRGRADVARTVIEATLAGAAEHEFVYYTARAHAIGARAEAALAERARAHGDSAARVEAAARARRLTERIERLLSPELWHGAPPQETVAYAAMTAAEAERAAGTADDATWRAVAERWGACGLVLDAVYARIRQAECLSLAGERKRASEVVAGALATARACAAEVLVDELEALARRARLSADPAEATLAADAADGLERLGLTERERAVLELVAAGMTNRQIGEQLFISTSTAGVHVSRILAKLGVGSRVEAATAAHRLGIVD
jgi:DNA-binding CsgD family transcriptional regulator/tetratricopeptide (TPR) repeat protein